MLDHTSVSATSTMAWEYSYSLMECVIFMAGFLEEGETLPGRCDWNALVRHNAFQSHSLRLHNPGTGLGELPLSEPHAVRVWLH